MVIITEVLATWLKGQTMSIKKILLIAGLSALFAGCSTVGEYGESGPVPTTSPTRAGMNYLLGRGVQQSDTRAFEYFSQGANADDAFAQNELAYMYAAGKGTSRDYARALFWYKKAAEHGLASAQFNLGLMYLKGLGTKPDRQQAQQWFQKSANHGFEPARQALARL